MRLFIPELGTRLRLLENWSTPLGWEERNMTVIKEFFPEAYGLYMSQLVKRKINLGKNWSYEMDDREDAKLDKFFKDNQLVLTLKKGSILEVDRIYIRKGNSDFSSVTFKLRLEKVLRFWAKLSDVNQIDCEKI